MIRITKEKFTILGIIALFGLTAFSTVVGSAKIYHALNISRPVDASSRLSDVLGEQVSDTGAGVEQPTSSPVPGIAKTITKKTTTSVLKSSITNNESGITSGGCMITLFGGQYDITNLRKTHSGGDVFVCGADMTSVYQSRHGSNLAIMSAYRISSTQSPIPTPVPTISPANPNTGGCIITLFGGKYDVTRLRQTHSGGDVFTCGADMTAIYQSRHGTNLSMMEKYKVGPVIPTQPPIRIPTVTPRPTLPPVKVTPTPWRPPSREEEDDRDDISREREDDD